jgi:hypothetical protein
VHNLFLVKKVAASREKFATDSAESDCNHKPVMRNLDATDGDLDMRSAIAGGLFSVLMMASTAHATTNLALGQPTTSDSVNNAYGYTFSSSAVTDGVKDDSAPGGVFSYWIAQDGVTSAFVTIDLGAVYNITGFTLNDTHNGSYFDRGTNAFAIGIGSSAGSSQAAALSSPTVSGSFSVAQWKDLSDLSVEAAGTGRYVTFQALSAYGNATGDTTGLNTSNGSTVGGFSSLSVGLGEFAVAGTLVQPVGVPEPISMAILGTGLVGLLAMRRRSI